MPAVPFLFRLEPLRALVPVEPPSPRRIEGNASARIVQQECELSTQNDKRPAGEGDGALSEGLGGVVGAPCASLHGVEPHWESYQAFRLWRWRDLSPAVEDPV